MLYEIFEKFALNVPILRSGKKITNCLIYFLYLTHARTVILLHLHTNTAYTINNDTPIIPLIHSCIWNEILQFTCIISKSFRGGWYTDGLMLIIVLFDQSLIHIMMSLLIKQMHYQAEIPFEDNVKYVGVNFSGRWHGQLLLKIWYVWSYNQLSSDIKLILQKELIVSIMTYAWTTWEFIVDMC
jgi:hypothetical protein